MGAHPGPRNLITDVAGLRVGNAEDKRIKSGTTVLVADQPFRCAVDVMGGAPGTRETDLLTPDKMVQAVDALVLSGGSAFGLDAASGVADALARQGRGFEVGPVHVPIVPAAILFDLINGGDKIWDVNPYRALGERALAAAAESFEIGSAGAGFGALAARVKGGLGSASLVLGDGIVVGALVAANPTGQVTMGNSPHFWAAPFEFGSEFGGLGTRPDPVPFMESATTKRDSLEALRNTTIAIVATNATMTKAQLKRMAVAAQDGMARSISPSHTLVDGDLVFALSTSGIGETTGDLNALEIGHAAATCLARAIARAAYSARPEPGDILPTWQAKYGN
jgi:D-aminopeptidase